MERYSEQQIEELKNVKRTKTLGVENEEYIRFLDYKEYYPLKIIMVGRTYPNEKYYVLREKSDISVMEYINSGEGYVFVNNKKIKVGKGDFIYLRSGYKHNYYADKKDPYKKTWMNFNSVILDELASKIGVADACVIKCDDIGLYFENILEISQNTLSSSMAVNNIFKIAISILLRVSDELNINSSYSLADKIKELLDSSICSNKNINDICNELNYSRQQICKVFTNKFSISPIDYLIDKKIEGAKVALKYSNMSIKKIYPMFGFSSQQYFSLIFKSKTGLKPLEYKKKYEDK